MKRRTFLGNVVLGSSSLLLGGRSFGNLNHASPGRYQYGVPGSFEELLSKDKQLVIRVEVKAIDSKEPVDFELLTRVKKGKINRRKSYFFDPSTQISKNGTVRSLVNAHQPGILVFWIDDPDPETNLHFELNGNDFEFKAGELVESTEFHFEHDGIKVSVNYLLDKEIGFMQPAEMGMKDPGNDFRFSILADPQGGAYGPKPKSENIRILIHNAFIRESVRIVNELNPQPEFTMILGDIVDAQGETEHFEVMHDFLKELKSPVLYEMGNHESPYKSVFTPGYNFKDFDNYFTAQKAMNGMEKLVYSFNLGKWHFIVWPDPLRNNFWETHPHYFDWLERDLEEFNHRPTVFLQHIPMHPMGINPLVNYAESIQVKQLVTNILARHGNVKYVFSGHVHIPIRSSFKTAVNYNGMNMINLPAAGYRPRAFGEEEWHGGPSQGALVADIKGNDIKVYFKTVSEEVYEYPGEFAEFQNDEYPLWFQHKWQLPAAKDFRNGSFEDGLEHWAKRYVYTETEEPSNIREVQNVFRKNSQSALYLMSKQRGYKVPGQDRLPQNINHVCQAIEVNGKPGILNVDYRVDGKNSNLDGFCGAFIWIEAFRKSFHLFNIAYWVGFSEVNVGGKQSFTHVNMPQHFQLDETPDVWQTAEINVDKDVARFGKSLSEMQADRLVVNLGTWNVNDGVPVQFAAWFDNLRVLPHDESVVTNVGGKPLQETPLDKKWWRGKYDKNDNIAGEHRYIRSTRNPDGI